MRALLWIVRLCAYVFLGMLAVGGVCTMAFAVLVQLFADKPNEATILGFIPMMIGSLLGMIIGPIYGFRRQNRRYFL